MDEPAVTIPPEPQFRTYASDVANLTAKLTGQPQVKGAPLPASMPLPTAVPEPPKPAAPALAPLPAEPPPAKIIPKAPTTDESREAVLARLRARAPAPPTPTPAPAAPAQIIPKAPSTDEAREEVLARLQARAAPVAPTPAPVVRSAPPPVRSTPVGLPPLSKTPVAAPSAIHTYKSDFSDEAKQTGASKISILAAEQNARSSAKGTQLKPEKKSHTLLIASAALLILAGGTSVYFAYSFVMGHPPVIIPPSVPSLISADDHVELKGTGTELRKGLVDLAGKQIAEGGVVVAYITYASSTATGTTTLPAAGGALISALGLSAPEIFMRNVNPASTVGVVRAGGETRPFFLFRVSSFERTFAGMLDWEPTLDDDLALLYPAYPDPTPAEGTTTATEGAPFRVAFIDEVVENHDVRVLRDASGRALMLYGYRDKQTLIIARNEAAFSELLKRLAATRAQ